MVESKESKKSKKLRMIKLELQTNFHLRTWGKKIVQVEYDERNYPVIRLDDGSAIWIQSDDESNGPGVPVLVQHDPDQPTGQRETGMWQIWSD